MMNSIGVFKQEIVRQFSKEGLDLDVALIEKPKEKSYGDLAVPCFIFSKKLKKSPIDIALDLSKKVEYNDYISDVKNVGPYLNFFINKNKLAKDILIKINEASDKDSILQKKKSQKVMIEFCSPNTNKPLHLGHVRNCLLGESISTILKYTGDEVIKSCLINDRGIHICKSMVAYDLWGNNTNPKKAGKKGDHLVGSFYVKYAKYEDDEIKEKVSECLRKWENNDSKTRALWKKMNKWVIDGFEQTYKRMGVSFDKYYYESEMYDKGKDIIMDALEKDIFIKKDGAIVAPLEEYKIPNKVLIRSDGTTIYITQDIYLAIQKIKDYNLDSSIYVVGSEQNLHFQQLFKILDLLGYQQADKCYHLSYGMVNLPDGKMKSREGTVVDADDLMDELDEIAASEIKKREPSIKGKKLKERAHKIAMAGLKFFLLKIDPVKDMTYNPKESLSFEGETGPYVQYTAVRIKSIIDKSKKNVSNNVDFERMQEPELNLVAKLSEFDSVVQKAAFGHKPSLIANYLIELCQEFNSYYHDVKIINTGMELERLLLIDCIRSVIVKGLYLLGIEVPQKM